MNIRIFLIFIFILQFFFSKNLFSQACSDSNPTVNTNCFGQWNVTTNNLQITVNNGATVHRGNPGAGQGPGGHFALQNNANNISITVNNGGAIGNVNINNPTDAIKNNGIIDLLDIKTGGYTWGYARPMSNYGTITTFNNAGVVDGYNDANFGFPFLNDKTINTLTNTGKFSSTIRNNQADSQITTLNNLQGKSAYPLRLIGKLPTNYNIVINSTSDYGQMSVNTPTGATTFGIYSGSTVSAGITYQDVLKGVSASNLSSLTGTYGAYSWSLAYDGTNYDLTFTPTRSAYNQTVTNPKLTTNATKFENIRTAGKNSVLTTKLDSLSSSQLESYLKKSQGTIKAKTNTQAIQSQSNFKTALSTITAPKSLSPAGRGPSPITNLTKTNFGNLTLADLKTNELYASIQPANFSSDDKLFNQESNQSSTNVLEFFKSNKNRDLISNDLKESGYFLRTFGSITNYAAINSDDNSYNNDSYGLYGGLQHKINENLYQGYSLGFSTNKLTLDGGEGNTKTNTIHADIYRKIEEKEYGATISFGTYVSFIDNVRNITETSEILKSSPTNSGVDLKLEFVKNLNLFGLNFYPSVSITGSYGLVENYKEKGGSGSALEVRAHNVLATKPEIGFRFENNVVETEKITEGLNFSLFASRQKYHDGHTSTSSLIGENNFTGSTLPKIKDEFLTAGLGYAAKNIDEKSNLNFNLFLTQSTNNALNSSLFSISYNKVF
jgi:hypothetical protein